MGAPCRRFAQGGVILMASQEERDALAAALAATDLAITSINGAQDSMQKIGSANPSLTKISTQLDAIRDGLAKMQKSAHAQPQHRIVQ